MLTSPSNIDISLEKFKEYKIEFENYCKINISESDTRSKILDIILKDILGWEEQDIEREGYSKNSGYFDYELRTSTFGFVVEAKRVHKAFVLPEKINYVKIKTLMSGNQEVITQIRNYLSDRSLSYGVISNGSQFIIGKFINTNGENWLENKCLIYQDLEKIEKNFIEFYNLLSRESILLNGRIKTFIDDSIGKVIISSPSLNKKNEELIRNDLSDKLIPIINRVFTEIYELNEENNFELLQNCYVSNADLDKHYTELDVLFNDDPPNFDSRIIPVRNTSNTHEQVKQKIENSLHTLPDPIIIIGSKGAGKTTFIRYFIDIILDPKFKKKRPIVYVDFRKYTKQQILDTNYIYKKIIENLLENYPDLNLDKYGILKVMYKKEIESKIEGVWFPYREEEDIIEKKIADFIEDKQTRYDEHLATLSQYIIKPSNKRLCIIFDNADQLDFEIQKEVFLLAQSIYRNFNCLVILSLREGYFYQWKSKPPFDAYQSNVFHITAPSYSEVLQKRLQYIIEKKIDFENIKGNIDNVNFNISYKSLPNLFKSLYTTLFEHQNSEILKFLKDTSYPDIRNGLGKFNSFLTSGHTKVSQYVTIDNYNIPIWEFIKSVGLKSHFYYDHSDSEVYNLFYPTSENKNLFTKIRILFHLFYYAEENLFKEYYFKCETLLDLFIKFGYSKNVIEEELNLLLDYKLIETQTISSDTENIIKVIENDLLKITQSGVYYINDLLCRFHYLDLILQDTPIYDENCYENLLLKFPQSDNFGKRELSKRLQVVEEFMKYLEFEEKKDHHSNELNKFSKAFDFSICDHIFKKGLNNDLQRIRNLLKK